MVTVLRNGIHQQLDTLRTENEHHIHQAQGDVGGRYHDQTGTDSYDIAEEHFKPAKKARLNSEVSEADVGDTEPVLIVVMGVSGCGKSTIGAALAYALGIPFTDADTLHPQSNIDKMTSGIPLTDADRQPWLERVRVAAMHSINEQAQLSNSGEAEGGRLKGVVVGCSALKRRYRDTLRGFSEGCSDSPSSLPTYFIHIRGSRSALMTRMESRKGHFMKTGMLDSQLQTLEPPEETDERNIVIVDLEKSTEVQIEQAKEGIRKLGLSV